LQTQELKGGGSVKKLIVYDLDGTLAESKSSLDAEMAARLHDLLGIVKVAVISGGGWPQFQKQLLSHLPQDERLANLSLLPTCGTKFYQYSGDWKKLYDRGSKRQDTQFSKEGAGNRGLQGGKDLGRGH
jgi:hydroxymethylpyrimidine pyrophosphatase-like HAD family hydrolase